MISDPKVEFSRIVIFDEITSSGVHYEVEAKEEERKKLAARFELITIHSLKAKFDLSRADEPGGYEIVGDVIGDVVQTCVATLKDVPAHVEAKVNVLLRPSKGPDSEEEFMIDLEDERDIEYYTNESIDLGEIAAQYLYLNLDPFPHAPDAPEFPEDHTEEPLSPLAKALETLKKK